jgi:hypothetical protein
LRTDCGRQHTPERYPEAIYSSFPNIVGCSPFIVVELATKKFCLVMPHPVWHIIPAENMKPADPSQPESTSGAPARSAARPILLGSVFFLAGALVSALFLRSSFPKPAPAGPAVSTNTQAVVENLPAPVEVRFYSLLDAGAAPALREFSHRVDQFLSTCQELAPGKVKLVRFDSAANPNPNAAVADGIQGFDLDKGDGCYLGIALVSKGRKEVLSRLQPEWELALQADFSRALQRVAQAAPAAPGPTAPAPLDTGLVEQVKKTIPDPASTTLEEGTQQLRTAALGEFMAAATGMQTQIGAAEQRLKEVQQSGTAAEQEQAMRKLQELQAAQTQKLKEIAAHSQALVDTLTRLKSAGK